jgi:hypothetical protein
MTLLSLLDAFASLFCNQEQPGLLSVLGKPLLELLFVCGPDLVLQWAHSPEGLLNFFVLVGVL